MKTIFKTKQSGFTLVETLLSAALLSMSVLTLATFSNSAAELDRKFKTRSNLLQVRTEIVAALSNPDNWADTVEKAGTSVAVAGVSGGTGTTTAGNVAIKSDSSTYVKLNPDLVCVRDNTACTSGHYPLTLLREDGTVLIDSTNLKAGFTREGVACNTYGDATENNKCIFRYTVTWAPTCPKVGACIRPQITTQTTLSSTESDSVAAVAALETQMNMQMNMLIEQPISLPPVARSQSATTNSSVEYPADTVINVNPLTAVTSKHEIELVPFDDRGSANGGTVHYISPTQVSYKPKDGFYGVDFFSYKVRDIATQKTARGTITVKVMTPFTWTGLAGAAQKGSSLDKNFCGKVVNGVCDGKTFPASGWGLGYHYNLVFNNTCTNCEAVLDGVTGAARNGVDMYLGSIELAKTFSGKVSVAKTLAFGTMQGPWRKAENVLVEGGTFDVSGINTVYIYAGDRGWMYFPPESEDYALKIKGAGRFISPKNLYVNGAFYAENANNFVHNDGSVYLLGIWARNQTIYAPNTEFFNLNFGWYQSWAGGGLAPAWSYGYAVSSNLNVKNNAGIWPGGQSDSKVTNGKDPFTWQYSATMPVVSVKGNLIFGGRGGSHCDFNGANSCQGPIFEMNGATDQLIQGLPVNGLTTYAGLTAPIGGYGGGPKITGPGPINLANLNDWATAPSIRINKTTGKITMDGAVAIRKTFEVASVATYDFSHSALIFNNTSCGDSTFSPGPATDYNDVYEMMAGCSARLNLGSNTINVFGNYAHYASGGSHLYGDSMRSAKIRLYGDFKIDGFHDHDLLMRAVEVQFVGPGDQFVMNMNAAGVPAMSAHMLVNKATGTVYLQGTVATMADLNVASGTLAATPGSTFRIHQHGVGLSKSVITAPNTTFENLEIFHVTELGSDIKAKNLTIGTTTSGGGLNSLGRTITVQNDLTLTRSHGNVNKIVMGGAGAQKITFTDPALGLGFTTYNIDIRKPAGAPSVSYFGTGRINNLCSGSPLLNMDPASSLTMSAHLQYMGAPGAATFVQQNGATFAPASSSQSATCLAWAP